MRGYLQALLQPLNLAALLTLGTVALSIHGELGDARPLGWTLLAAFSLLFLLLEPIAARPWLRAACYAVLALLALGVVALAPRTGTSPVILVILLAALAMDYPPGRVLLVAAALNIALYLLLVNAGHPAPGLKVTLYLGFQAFAALVAHYARSAERARDRLALVNADLLATRALLADSSRDAERLRVARELHDVAGHKLTALRLNLRALGAQEGASPQLRLAEQLSAELLGDIRGVVHALRDVDGLDIATALHALAAPFPQPRLELAMHGDVRITDPALADAVLRVVQESLTNSARHADAKTLRVTLSRDAGALRIRIEDDGRLHGAVREGNGLTGMRERIEERGGRITFARGDAGALRIDAALPA